jgi:cell division protein FtsW
VARKLKTDRVLFITAMLLVCVSVVMVYSAAVLPGGRSDYQTAVKQALWAVLGVSVLAVTMRIDYRTYKNESFVWALLALVGVLLVAVLFSDPVNGARRWLLIGGLGIQPSELAKLACVLFTALMLERRMHRINEISYSLLPVAIVVGLVAGLIYWQPDMGTALSVLLIAGTMVFAAGLSFRYLVGLAVAGVPAVVVAVMAEAYRIDRWIAFLDPWADRNDTGYQAVQAQIAIGSGGVLGRGLTDSVQKLFYLPYPASDFIYAVIGEEFGLLGTTGILLCFCVIAWRGLRIALRAEDAFGSFVALGITTMVCAQALVNISVVLSLLPTKGIPLPLISAGGSSLLVSLVSVGVLLNIPQHERGGET